METLGALFGNIGLSETATLGWKTEFTNWLFSLGLCQGKLRYGDLFQLMNFGY